MAETTDTTAADVVATNGIEPATEFSPSGAPRQTSEIDPAHPAVDNDPRRATSEVSNRIDFNDPTVSGADAVATALGMKTEAAPTKAAKA